MQTPVANVTESHIRAAIAQLMEDDSQLGKFERRQESRYPFFQPVTVDFENGSLSGITRQISPSGIGLLHCAPLNSGPVTVTMRNNLGYAVTLPIKVSWCRRCGPHWYVSGGQFLDLQSNERSPKTINPDEQRVVSNPAAAPDTDLFDDIVASVRQTVDGVVDRPTFGSFYANRRSEDRYCATLPVTAVLEDESRSIRDSIRAVTRDISKNGISLISDQPVTARFLSLEITNRDGQKTLTARMQMLRCRSIGGRFHEIAGNFVTKVYPNRLHTCLARSNGELPSSEDSHD